MSTITLPNIRVSSDLTVSVRLKDNGVAIDWSTLNNVKASIYSDAQRALAGRCDVSVDAEDPTVLVCQYAANKPQYVGVCRIVVSAKYMGETKTYDKPAFNFVRWTADQDGEQITIDDPDVDVEIEVSDVSSSLLDEAIRAAFTAAEEAVDAKGQVLETEAEVEAAEALRVSAEESRVEAEEGRAEAEAARVEEEAVRVSAEDARVVAENARAAAEDLREGAEDDRAAAETARETAEAARVAAEALRVTAEGSRETAEAAREAQASADHTTAASDHTQAAADHTQAASDHTTAASDHTQAGADHTLAAADHVTAGEDHAQAQDDHEVMEGYDTRLGSVESEVSQLEAEVTELDTKVKGIIGPFNLSFITGKYILIPNVGEMIGGTTDLATYSYARTYAKPGDKVTVQGVGGSGPRLWAFIDENGAVLSRADASFDARTPIVITAPNNTAELIVNVNNGYVYGTIYEAQINIENEVGILNEKISDKVTIKPGKNLLNPDKCISGYYIKRSDGKLDTATGYYATPFIPASSSGLYCNNGVRGGTDVGAAVYDANGDFLRETGNGKVYTYQSGDAFVRFSLQSLTDAYIYTGTIEQDYEEYNPAGGYIKDVAFDALANSMRGFEYGKNRLNPADLVSGHYIDRNNGQLDTSSQLQATGFIPVSKKGLVCNNAYWGGNAIGGAVYDINKVFIRSTGKIYTYQEGEYFVRFSLLNADVDTAQVEEGSVSTEYVPFSAKEIINPNYLPENTSGTANTIGIFLPAKIYAVVGDTLQIFFKQCIQAVEPLRYNVIVVCRKGKQYHRYFEYTPTVSDIGETDFIINVKDDFGNILGTRKCTLSTVAAPSSPATVKNILCIGDSLTANGYWPSEAYRRLVASGGTPQGDELTNISFVGSMTKDGAGYLGKSGWRWADYCTEGRPAFRFSVGVGVAANPGAVYSNNGHNYTVIEVSNNQTILCSAASATDLPTASGTLTKVSGGGDSTIVFSSVSPDSQNPFWDYTNQEMTFVPYVNNYCGGQLDAVFVLLGGNGLFSEQMQYVETFADTLHSEYPNCKLYILGMNVPSMELMMPGYGASGENYADTFNVLVTIEKLKESYRAFAEQDGYKTWVSMFDLGCQFDGDYNYPITMKDVNTRNSTEQEPYDNNVLHPSTIGYYQFADAVYRCIVAEFCQS